MTERADPSWTEFKTIETTGESEDVVNGGDQAHDTLYCHEGQTTVTRLSNEAQAKVESRRMLVLLHESKFGCGHGPAWLESMGG